MSSPVGLGWRTQIPKRLANHEHRSLLGRCPKEPQQAVCRLWNKKDSTTTKQRHHWNLGSNEASSAPIGPCPSSNMIKRPSNHIPLALEPDKNHVQKQRSLEADAKVATLDSSVSPVSATGPADPGKAASALEKSSSNRYPPVGDGHAPCCFGPLGCCVKISSLGALQQHAKRSCYWDGWQGRSAAVT